MASMITRPQVQDLVPTPVTKEIINGTRRHSVAMSLLRKLPNMTSNKQKQPVLSMLPIADFVDGDSGMKVTTDMAWSKKQMVAGEIACIVPVPQAVLDDAEYDIWGEARPLIEEAIGRVFDRQVFSERNPKAPMEWPDPLIPAAIAAGNVVTIGTGTDIADDVADAIGILEDDGYDVTGMAAQKRLRNMLRKLRNSNNDPIYTPLTADVPASIYNVPSHFVGKGVWDRALALALLGDWSLAVYALRQDMIFQIFDSGVISDEDGKIIYNLLQQDMVAMRVVMRLGWQVANPIDIDRPYGTGFPFSVLAPAPTTVPDPDPGNGNG